MIERMRNAGTQKSPPSFCEIEPGVRIKLDSSLSYKDTPRGATLAVSLKEWERLAATGLASRVDAPIGYAPTEE